MLHPKMLDDVRPTCWLRLNRPLHEKDSATMLEENKPQIQQLLMRFFCLSSSNMAAMTSTVSSTYIWSENLVAESEAKDGGN